MTKKLNLDVKDEELWAQVLIYKVKRRLKTNNEAVLELIRKGLDDQRKANAGGLQGK